MRGSPCRMLYEDLKSQHRSLISYGALIVGYLAKYGNFPWLHDEA